jgi:hypothetical protein
MIVNHIDNYVTGIDTVYIIPQIAAVAVLIKC